jgi:hypothetical protein
MSQLQGIEQKDIIKTVTGKVTKLWEPKKFNGPKGEFEIQGGAIEIDGQEYGLKFFNNNQNGFLEGQVVTLSSTRNKFGVNGVSLEHESFTKKDGTNVDRDLIKVTKTGKVTVDGEVVQAEKSQLASQPVNKADQGAAMEDIVKSHMYVDSLVRIAYKDKAYEEETLRSYVSSIFIESNRKGIVIKAEPPKEEYDPSDWASAIVPSGSHKGKRLAEIGKPAMLKLYEHFLEKGFATPFGQCVAQAGKDLGFDDELPDQAW